MRARERKLLRGIAATYARDAEDNREGLVHQGRLLESGEVEPPVRSLSKLGGFHPKDIASSGVRELQRILGLRERGSNHGEAPLGFGCCHYTSNIPGREA